MYVYKYLILLLLSEGLGCFDHDEPADLTDDDHLLENPGKSVKFFSSQAKVKPTNTILRVLYFLTMS
jgi:hypothetical protein